MKTPAKAGAMGLVIVAANPDTAHSPSSRHPSPAVVIPVSVAVRGEKRRASKEEAVMPMYEPSMMKKRGMMVEIGSMPAADTARGHRHAAATPSTAHVPATPSTTHMSAATAAHVTAATMTGHGKRREQRDYEDDHKPAHAKPL